MFSPLLSKHTIPESIWLPPEIRSLLEPDISPAVSNRTVLRQKLDILHDRIDHIESLIGGLDLENRLRRLEELDPITPSKKHRGG